MAWGRETTATDAGGIYDENRLHRALPVRQSVAKPFNSMYLFFRKLLENVRNVDFKCSVSCEHGKMSFVESI